MDCFVGDVSNNTYVGWDLLGCVSLHVEIYGV
jgi:hypothetical protein